MKYKLFILLLISMLIIFGCGKDNKINQSSDMNTNISFAPAALKSLKIGNTYEMVLTVSSYGTKLEEKTASFTFGQTNNFSYDLSYEQSGPVTVSVGVYYTPPYSGAARENVGSGESTINLLRGQTITVDIVINIKEDNPPVAEAGNDQTIVLGNSVILDGSATKDKEGDALYYIWQMIKAPSSVSPSLASIGSSFKYTPPVVGEYKFQLLVIELKNTLKIDSDIVKITVTEGSEPSNQADVVFGAIRFDTPGSGNNNQFEMTPEDVAVYINGDTKVVYVSDREKNRVLVFMDQSGYLRNYERADKVLGQPNYSDTQSGANIGNLNEPQGLAVDSKGNLYVADYNNGRVLLFLKPHLTASDTSQKPGIAGDTIPDKVFGNVNFNTPLTTNNVCGGSYDHYHTFLDTPLEYVQDVAVDGNDNLYVLDVSSSGYGRVSVYTNPVSGDTVIDKMLPGDKVLVNSSCYLPGASASNLYSPYSLTVDASGNVYVFDLSWNRIVKYNSPIKGNQSAAVVLNQTGLTQHDTTTHTNQSSWISSCKGGLAVDKAGNLYAALSYENRILRFPKGFSSNSKADSVIGQVNFTDSSAGIDRGIFNYPLGLTFDANNGMYVADRYNNRVLYFAPGSDNTTVPATPGSFMVASAGSDSVLLKWKVPKADKNGADSPITVTLVGYSTTPISISLTDTQWRVAFKNTIVSNNSSINVSNYSLGVIPILTAGPDYNTYDSALLTGLTAGQTYYFGVLAFDNEFNQSGMAMTSYSLTSFSGAPSHSLSDTIANDGPSNSYFDNVKILHDSNDHPYIAYPHNTMNNTNVYPRVAYYNGSTWATAFNTNDSMLTITSDPVFCKNSAGTKFMYIFRYSGGIAGAYIDTSNGTKVVKITGDVPSGKITAVWNGDTCYIIYFTAGDLKVYGYNTASETGAVLASTSLGTPYCISAALVSSDTIYIVYVTNGAYKYINYHTYTISSHNLSSSSSLGSIGLTSGMSNNFRYLDIFAGSNNQPVVIYEDDNNIAQLSYNGSSWDSVSIESSPTHFSGQIEIDAVRASNGNVYLIRNAALGGGVYNAQTYQRTAGTWSSSSTITENLGFSTYNGFCVSTDVMSDGSVGYVYSQGIYNAGGGGGYDYYIRYYNP